MTRLRLSALLAASAASLAAAPLLADAPGGGGGGSAPSMSAPQYDAAAEYRKGIEALQANQFADAKKAFDRVLAVAPSDANTNFLAGLAAAGLGDLKGARAITRKRSAPIASWSRPIASSESPTPSSATSRRPRPSSTG
jgi:tetratricopeptide (TPR) repeat protein